MEFDKFFELTDDHIKLINHMWVSWHDGHSFSGYGSPVIDLKRPYGNSDIVQDIHEILTGESIDEEELDERGIDYDDYLSQLEEKYRPIHKETETALQIILHTKSFETGTYGLIGYGKAWVKIK